MQTQATRLQSISATQSLATVQTLLRAGLGCITYLRNLLPADNFSPSYFASSSEDSQRSSEGEESAGEPQLKRNVSGFKIMTVTRGFTEEADKLLNYMEYGIFDALQKQYLRSFIFAIYLDNKDPNNIVEAYTFNFKYHTVPGTDIVLPVMTLEDTARTAREAKGRQPIDPVVEAAKQGKAPTLGDVKKSVKALLKRLINATTQMDNLPKRRYATFKLFYNDNTPPDYEPPHFHPGDVDKDKWFFTTHDKDEVPDKWSVGTMDTGYHGVSVSVASVTSYLPSSTEDNSAPFLGLSSGPQAVNNEYQGQLRTPIQEATLRAQQIDMQMKDADERNIVWGMEEGLCDQDPDGENGLDRVLCADGTFAPINVHDSGVDIILPIGIRNDKGGIEPIPSAGKETGEKNPENVGMNDYINVDLEVEALFGGVSETAPNHVAKLKPKETRRDSDLGQTQEVEYTQEVESTPRLRDSISSITAADIFPDIVGRVSGSRMSLPSSNLGQSFESSLSSTSSRGIDIDTQMLKGMVMDTIEGTSEVGDTEMLDVETVAAQPPRMVEDSIASFERSGAESATEDISTTPQASVAAEEAGNTERITDNGLDCECGITIEDGCCFCEGGCGRWYHVWCMGYHSIKDQRIPAKFICFDCRIRADSNWDLIKIDLYPKVISKLKELALFRRAIKIAETYNPNTAPAFTKAIGCQMVLAHQLFKRLETEGFVEAEIMHTDDLGLLETRTKTSRRKSKTKGKQMKQRKQIQKTRYVFNHALKTSPEYLEYFNPSREVESRILGFSQLNASSKHRTRAFTPSPVRPTETLAILPPALPYIPQPESQTQPETQSQIIASLTQLTLNNHAERDHNVILKREKPASEHESASRPSKKIKISVGPAVDLGD